jgi:hypothetical protein
MKTARRLLLPGSLLLVAVVTFAAHAATRVWTGAGGNALWSNAANWDGGVAPKGGDDLVFAGQSTQNDLTGLSVASITVTAGAPVVSGNSVTAGAVHVAGGKLTLTRSQITGTTNITVDSGTLMLDHTDAGNITVNSGALEVTSEHGLSSATSLTLGPSAQFVADVYGTQWDPYVDYLVVHGNVSLGGSTLVLNLMHGFPIQPQLLIHNMGGNPVNGTFAGHADGEIFIQSLMAFRVGYHGGSSGNDVPLVLLAASDTWLSLTPSHSPSPYGVPLTILANVKTGNWGFNAGPLSGTVEFFDGATSLGSAVVSGGLASLTTYTLAPGTHTITSHFSGGGNFGPNDGHPLTQVIQLQQLFTSTTLGDLPLSAYAGQPSTLIAVVRTTGVIPTAGSVTFFDGGTAIGSAALDSTGRAALTTTLPPGQHMIYATFGGSGIFNPSTSNTVTESIAPPAPTQTALSVSSNPAPAGAPLLLRATVVANYAAPQGMVNFMDGAQLLGSANVASDQTASLMVDTLTPGMHNLTALYLGAGGFNTSTSSAVVQQIAANAADCAPSVLVPPSDVFLSANGTATLAVVASGGDPQSFQWYFGAYPDVTRPFATTATATLINTTTPTDVWVLITNACGTAHATAHVNAYVPPRRRAARH